MHGLPSLALKFVLQFICWTLIFALPAGGERLYEKAYRLVLENPVMSVVLSEVNSVTDRFSRFMQDG